MGCPSDLQFAPYPFWGAQDRRGPLSVLAVLFLYNKAMDIVEDLFPVRRNIDDHIDELDELGIL